MTWINDTKKHYDILKIIFKSIIEKLYENPAENYMFSSCMSSAIGVLGEDNALDFMFFAFVRSIARMYFFGNQENFVFNVLLIIKTTYVNIKI
jgi:hypothetical protein